VQRIMEAGKLRFGTRFEQGDSKSSTWSQEESSANKQQ
jgi:hypothetical protein